MNRGRRGATLLCAFGVGAAAMIWLNHVNPPFVLTDDGIRDQLLVRDCVELGRCHLIGPATSLPGFHQGAVWLELLTAVRLAGGDAETQRAVVIALMALTVTTSFVVVWRWLRPAMALPAAVLLIAALGMDGYPSRLINPSGSPLPNLLVSAGLLCFALSARLRFLTIASVALAIAINVHVAAASLFPPLILIAALASARPGGALVVALVAPTITFVVTSRAALLANLFGVSSRGWSFAAVAGVAALMIVGVAFRPAFRRRSAAVRALLVAVILVAPFAIAASWLALWERHELNVTYWQPVLAPASAMVAAMIVVPFEIAARRVAALRWAPSVLTLGLAAVVGARSEGLLRPAPSREAWSLADSMAIADAAVADGWSYEDLVSRLQGARCRNLLAGMSVAMPPPAPASKPDRRQLQVVRAARERVPASVGAARVIELGPERALLREIDSWLLPDEVTACRVALTEPGTRSCVAAPPRAGQRRELSHFLFATRAYPAIHYLQQPPPYDAVYQLPLAPVAGEVRELAVLDDDPPGCRWQITRVEGVSLAERLPARRVRIRSDAAGRALVVFEKPFGVAACRPSDLDLRYPPCVFESVPGDSLARLVGAVD